jgi:hypothetical protein
MKRHIIELNNLYCTYGIIKYYITGVCSVIVEGSIFKLEGVDLSNVKADFGYDDLTSDFGGYYLQPKQVKNLENKLTDYPQFIWFIQEKIKKNNDS